jgi:hypothetical protein
MECGLYKVSIICRLWRPADVESGRAAELPNRKCQPHPLTHTTNRETSKTCKHIFFNRRCIITKFPKYAYFYVSKPELLSRCLVLISHLRKASPRVEPGLRYYNTLFPYDFALSLVTFHAGRAIALAVNCWPLIAESRVRVRISPCGICGG